MKLIATTCYSHVLHMLSCGPLLSECVYEFKFKFSTHNFANEDMAGYIETEITVTIKDLSKFAELYRSWYESESNTRLRLYHKAKNENLIYC